MNLLYTLPTIVYCGECKKSNKVRKNNICCMKSAIDSFPNNQLIKALTTKPFLPMAFHFHIHSFFSMPHPKSNRLYLSGFRRTSIFDIFRIPISLREVAFKENKKS